MTSRIYDAASSSSLINIMMRAQNRLYDANAQVASGKVSDNYMGISRETQRLINLETTQDVNQRYIDNNNLADLRLTIMDSSIQGIEEAMRDVRLSITNFNGRGQFDQISIEELQQTAFNNLKSIEAYLNTEVNGKFLFSGSVTDTEPVNLGITTLEDFRQKYDGAINEYPETRDAHLATISLSKDAANDDSPNITSTNWLVFREDDDTDATTSGTSSIEAQGDLFSGYEAGSRITISDTTNNNGEYTIQSVSDDGTKIYVETEMFTDEELPFGLNTQTDVTTATFTLPDSTQLTNTDTGNIDYDRDAGTIAALTIDSFENINVGDVIKIGGSGESNGSFTVTASAQEMVDTAQVDTITLAGTFEATDQYSVTIDGNTLTYTVLPGDTDMTGVGTSMRAAINADPTLSAIVTATDGGAGEIILTANTKGVAFTNSTTAVDVGGTDDSTNSVTSTAPMTMTLGGTLAATDEYTVTIDGNVHTYTVTGGEGDMAGVAAAMRAAINLDASVNTLVVASDGAAGEIILTPVSSTVPIKTSVGANDVAGANDNTNTFVTSPAAPSQVLADVLTVSAEATLTTGDGTVLDSDDTGRMVFNRSGDTITADRNGFAGLSAGDLITVAGTAENNGSYTIETVSADGKTVTIKDSKLADEGTTSGSNYFDLKVGTRYAFDIGADTIQAQDIDGNALTNIFGDLQEGDSITIANSPTNDGTYTVGSISSDGSTISLDAATQLVGATETDNSGADITSAVRGLSFHSGDKIVFDEVNETITLQDITSSTATADAFSNLSVGMQINLSGTVSNDGAFTIASISADGSSITVSEDIVTEVDFDPSATGTAVDFEIYATSGTIAADNSYYSGDELARQHRVDESRTIDWDLTAVHPAFEKAIRALSILIQGDYGTEGGLDQNRERVSNAQYLLNDALDKTTAGTPPYGTEIKLDLREVEFEHGFKQVIINDTREQLKNDNILLENFIAEIEMLTN